MLSTLPNPRKVEDLSVRDIFECGVEQLTFSVVFS